MKFKKKSFWLQIQSPYSILKDFLAPWQPRYTLNFLSKNAIGASNEAQSCGFNEVSVFSCIRVENIVLKEAEDGKIFIVDLAGSENAADAQVRVANSHDVTCKHGDIGFLVSFLSFH
jgi:hypothetical protein